MEHTIGSIVAYIYMGVLGLVVIVILLRVGASVVAFFEGTTNPKHAKQTGPRHAAPKPQRPPALRPRGPRDYDLY